MRHLVAGMSGGVVSTVLLHPLDLLKIRFAVDDGKVGKQNYSGLGQAVKSIVRLEGVRGLYRGVVANTVTSASSWGSYFLFYQVLKKNIERTELIDIIFTEHQAQDAGRHFENPTFLYSSPGRCL